MDSWIGYQTRLPIKAHICPTHTAEIHTQARLLSKLNIVTDPANTLRWAIHVQSWFVQLIINENPVWWDVQTLQFNNFLHNPALPSCQLPHLCLAAVATCLEEEKHLNKELYHKETFWITNIKHLYMEHTRVYIRIIGANGADIRWKMSKDTDDIFEEIIYAL